MSNSEVLNDTVEIVDSSLDETKNFQPLRPGGKKLDETIDIDSSIDSSINVNNNSPVGLDDSNLNNDFDNHPDGINSNDDNPKSENNVNDESDLSFYTPMKERLDIRDEFHNEDSTLDSDSLECKTGLSLPETCTLLETPEGSKVYLVGTAHFSKASQKDVADTIAQVHPDVVMLELCRSRTNILSFDEAAVLSEAQNLDFNRIVQTLLQSGTVQGAMHLLLLSMSAHLTKELGMAPGGEFRVAYEEAQKIEGCKIHLGDRPIQITLKRALASLSLWQKVKLTFNILTSKETITKEDIERCKQKDLLESMLEEMAGEFPALSRVFVEERDLFLSYSLHMALEIATQSIRERNLNDNAFNNKTKPVVVGVVGIGHVQGIEQNWNSVTPEQVTEVMRIPQPTWSERALKWGFKAGFYGVLLYGSYRVFRGPVTHLVKKWQ